MRNEITLAANIAFERCMALVQDLYDHPEIGNEEHHAMAVLSDALEADGFSVQRGYILPTAFLATYDSGKPGRTVAFMCEYDALPDVGHGCGHNLIAGIGVLSGMALKPLMDTLGGKLLVIGTPAEENFGGKVTMAEAGVFDGIDAALMIHPGSENSLGGRVNAIEPRKFEFHGQTAHGCAPQLGRSALDAAVMTYTALSMHRQYLEPGCFMHGIIRNGGSAANVIPDYASMEYYFRAPNVAGALELANHGIAAAEAAAKAARCELTVSVYEMPYGDIRINYALAEKLREKYTELGLPDVKPVDEEPAGSSDVGAVSYRCPTLQGNIKIVEEGTPGHSTAMACATIAESGRAALINGACSLADIAADILCDDAFAEAVRAEFMSGN